MNKKTLAISVLLIAALLINGCAISDYLTGKGLEEQYALLTEEDLEALNEQEIAEVEEVVEEPVEEVIEEPVPELIEEIQTPTESITIVVKESDFVRLQTNAMDPDEDPITFSFTEPLDQNGEWETDYGDAGEYFVTVTASDGQLSTSRQVLLIVERVNMPPVIENINDIVVDEGSTLIVTPKVSDPNGDEFTVTISEPVGNDGVWEIGYQDHGQYSMKVTAEDIDGLFAEQEVMITVNRKNMAPEIQPINNIEIFEGESVYIDPVVSDLNGDEVTVMISEPLGDDGEWETAFTDHGEYMVTVSATDGELTTVEEILLVVKDINKAPVILEIVQEGQEFMG
jgi:hypothetical protein